MVRKELQEKRRIKREREEDVLNRSSNQNQCNEKSTHSININLKLKLKYFL